MKAEEKKLSFEYLREEILSRNIRSDLKQGSIVILRSIFKDSLTHTEGEEDQCPNCKSKNTKSVKVRKNNGVIGPGFVSYLVDSYYSCKDCGTRFDPIKKQKPDF